MRKDWKNAGSDSTRRNNSVKGREGRQKGHDVSIPSNTFPKRYWLLKFDDAELSDAELSDAELYNSGTTQEQLNDAIAIASILIQMSNYSDFYISETYELSSTSIRLLWSDTFRSLNFV